MVTCWLQTDSNDMTYFIDFNIHIIGRALEDLKQFIVRKKQEESASLRLVEQIPDLSLQQAEILRDFIRYPTRYSRSARLPGNIRCPYPLREPICCCWRRRGS
jgi:hypothetical protein